MTLSSSVWKSSSAFHDNDLFEGYKSFFWIECTSFGVCQVFPHDHVQVTPLRSPDKWSWGPFKVPHSEAHHVHSPLLMVILLITWSVQFNSVVQSCPILYDLMDCSMPGLPVHHQLPELTQTHVHCIGDANRPSHPLSSPSPPTFNLSQLLGLFKWVSSSHQVAKVLEFQLQRQSFQWIFRTNFL